MFDIAGLVGKLVENEVRFIVIGGIAAVFHGAARATFDLDIVYERTSQNYENLINNTVEREIFNCLVLFLNLPTLIRVKKAAGRPKDYEAIAELESILGKK